MDNEIFDILEIKNMTTKELLDLRQRLDEEIKFREDVGREIDERKGGIKSAGVGGSFEHMVNLNDLRGGQ